ncbi:hypothetical protein [Gillisia hiemivivida]|uniref:Uncharacterized protein n=1 Tax=Gillisia hiemivivida TaxID=291190 RepID=A0A5C6ZX36_9FLAO|nr:hypothetical protein [Gillisia hiemivivida]TXD94885.1 hypothetical protein ES724_05295 [Gillisia hiemivivida]
MGTERFEDKIKRQLRDREIAPSAGSWDKLSAKLDETQQKKKPFVLWMGIAASIIGGILILSLVFNNTSPSDSPEMVDVHKEAVKLEENPVETSEEIFTQTQDEVEQVATSEVKKEQITPRSNPTVTPVNQLHQNNREAIAVIDNKSLLNQNSLGISIETTTDKILDLKLNDALTNVIANVENRATVTDAEVNKLLAEAAAKISRERYKTDFAVGKVNPQELLQDVEFEMDNSFRDKIFEILKEGYSKARTAVANRNY